MPLTVDQLCFIRAPGRCKGAPVRIHAILPDDLIEVRFLDARGPYAVGDLAKYAAGDILPALEPRQLVAYAPAYLRANSADPREYGRTARVVKRMEGTLVQLEWSDGLGPQTDTTEHLQVLVEGKVLT